MHLSTMSINPRVLPLVYLDDCLQSWPEEVCHDTWLQLEHPLTDRNKICHSARLFRSALLAFGKKLYKAHGSNGLFTQLLGLHYFYTYISSRDATNVSL